MDLGGECGSDCGACGPGDACGSDADCASGICNLGACIPDPLPGLEPCSTDAACLAGTCRDGVCDTVCGDGVCGGDASTPTENCGSSVPPNACPADCGPCEDGSPCVERADCESSVCNLGECIPEKLPGGAPCDTFFACISLECHDGACADVCGDGVCAGVLGGEICGDLNDGRECTLDCGLCGNGVPCTSNSKCASGACNFGFCIEAGSLGAQVPCTTDRACRSGRCDFGQCAAVCGDGICEGIEVCGADDGGPRCRTDCGRCPNGTPCAADAECEGGHCIFGFCADCKSVGDSCSSGEECCTGTCVSVAGISTCI